MDYAISDGVPSEMDRVNRMGAMDYYKLLSKHMEKIEELKKIAEENKSNK